MSDTMEEEISYLVEDPSGSIEDTIYGVFVSLISIFGIIGNTVSFFILTKPKLKSPVSICLQFLAVFDTMYLACVPLDTIFTYGPAIYWTYFVQWISWTVSVWATVGVSVERYIAVCHPLKAKYLCSRKRTLLFNLFIVFCSFVYNLPRVCLAPEISWKGESVEFSLYLHKRYGEKSLRHLPPWFFKNKFFIEVYYVWLDIIILYSIPLLSLTTLYTSIYIEARKANKLRQEMSQYHQSEIRLSQKIFAVIITFILCYTPVLLYKISGFSGFVPLEFYLPLSYVCGILTTVNSALNFILYTALRKEFRETFTEVFCNFCV